MKSTLYTILVGVLMSYSCAPIDVQAQETQIQESPMAAKTILDKADSLFDSRQYDAARDVYLQAMATAENESSELTEAYAMIARCYLITDRKEEGRPWVEKAKKAATPDMPLGWSRYLGVRGRFEWKDGQLEKATATFKEMYEYCHERQLHERAIDAAHMVAITGKPQEQIEWSSKGIHEAEAGNVTKWLGPLWNNLGATYEEKGEYNKSLEAYLKAREYHWKYGAEQNRLIADWAVGRAYRLTGDIQNAEKWLSPLPRWCQKIGDVEFEGLTYRELGEIEISKEHADAALDYFMKAEEKLRFAKMPEWDEKGYQQLQARITDLKSKPGR